MPRPPARGSQKLARHSGPGSRGQAAPVRASRWNDLNSRAKNSDARTRHRGVRSGADWGGRGRHGGGWRGQGWGGSRNDTRTKRGQEAGGGWGAHDDGGWRRGIWHGQANARTHGRDEADDAHMQAPRGAARCVWADEPSAAAPPPPRRTDALPRSPACATCADVRRSNETLLCAMERQVKLWAGQLGLADAHARASHHGGDEMDWQPEPTAVLPAVGADYRYPTRGLSASQIPYALSPFVAS